MSLLNDQLEISLIVYLSGVNATEGAIPTVNKD